MARDYPMKVEIGGVVYEYERILKDDFFSVNVLFRSSSGKRQVLKISDFRFILGWIFRPLACVMNGHEFKMYRRLGGIQGIPSAGPRIGRRAFYHEFVEGKTLFEVGKNAQLPPGFFDRILDMMRSIHAQGVIYLDSNKAGNYIVGDDGKPYLIDFQISLNFGRLDGFWRGIKRRCFAALKREDIYHVYKLKRRFQKQAMRPEEWALAERSSSARFMARFVGNPYRRIKRLVYPKGSNETVWFKWKRERDQAQRMP